MVALGLDIGSSSVKVAVTDLSGGKKPFVVRYPQQEMKISSPFAGWAEQHPDDWWTYVIHGIRLALSESGTGATDIVSIGISYQMHGLVIVDKDGQPLRSSIIWCDSRAVVSGDELAEKLGPRIYGDRLLNHPSNFTASKLYWVKTHESAVFDRIHKIMLPGDYISFRMSGEYTTTFTGLSEGIFFDFKMGNVSQEMMTALGISEDLMPRPDSSFGILCCTNTDFENLTGIKKGTPISYRAGDQPNNAFALGVLHSGQAAATGGTSGVVYAVSDDIRFVADSGVNTFAHVNHTPQHPSYGTLLCINGTGILYNWVRNNLFEGLPYSSLENIAAGTKSEGLVVLPFGNGAERMLQNRLTGSSFSGLDFTRHDKKHLLRASLEGIAFAFVYGMQGMQKMGINTRLLRTGNDNLFQSAVFAQTLADAADVTIDVYETTGAIGAAKGSAFGAGFVGDLDTLHTDLVLCRRYEPNTNSETQQLYARWKNILTDRLKYSEP